MLAVGTSPPVRTTLLNASRSTRFLKRFGWRLGESFVVIRGEGLDTILHQKGNLENVWNEKQRKPCDCLPELRRV